MNENRNCYFYYREPSKYEKDLYANAKVSYMGSTAHNSTDLDLTDEQRKILESNNYYYSPITNTFYPSTIGSKSVKDHDKRCKIQVGASTLIGSNGIIAGG